MPPLENNINEFKKDIIDLRQEMRGVASDLRAQAQEISKFGVKVSDLIKTAKDFDPGPGSIQKSDYETLLSELEKLRTLAISLKDNGTS